ncbi:MAG: hypothetical protein GQF41_0689 [Candidatus Rifleibacterium amylolyticum]|nr:MAG: hypothetical protein GQF41_0689 [Candidatus Rifleibacterium amylolyticum]
MNCHEFREWLENSPDAGLADIPAVLQAHVKSCPVCSALLKKLTEQCFPRLSPGLAAAIPDIKKKVMLQCSGSGRKSAEESVSILPSLWKLAWLSLVGFAILVMFYIRPGSPSLEKAQITAAEETVATITRIDREVEKRLAGADGYVLASLSDALAKGDSVRTGDSAEVELTFSCGSTVSLGPDAYFQVSDNYSSGYHQQGRAIFQIKSQTPPVPVEISTPIGTTGVLGTVFVQQISSDTSFVGVLEGVVEFRSKTLERKLLRAGHLLLIASSGKILDVKEPGRDKVSSLMNLKRLLPVEALDRLDKGAAESPAGESDASSQHPAKEEVDESMAASPIRPVPDAEPAEAFPEDKSSDPAEGDDTDEEQIEDGNVPGSGFNSTLGISGN